MGITTNDDDICSKTVDIIRSKMRSLQEGSPYELSVESSG